MYPWIIGLTLRILKPSPQWESYCLYFVNFLIYLFALICFEFFLSKLILYHRLRSNEISKEACETLPEWAIIILGYSLFIYTSLKFIGLMQQTPDMCLAAFVYLISGIILHIQLRFASWFVFILLGLALGCSYLTKAAMFPLAFVFLVVSMFCVDNVQKRIPYLLIGLVVFLLTASPYIISISKSRGYLTFSDVAKFNYVLYVNKLPDNWVDGTTGPMWGKPVHPMKKIFNVPPVYEFGTPFKEATYPRTYDDTYWFVGIQPHFDLKEQLKTILINLKEYYRLFFKGQDKLILCCFILFYMSCRWISCIKDIFEHWSFLAPSIAAMGMYSVVHVEDRYIGAFVVLLWMGLLCSVRLFNSQDSRKLLSCVTIIILIVIMIRVSREAAYNISNITSDLIAGKNKNISWLVASSLKQMGLEEGDKIACIADDAGTYWAKLLKLKIVAQLMNINEDSFWKTAPQVKSKIINAFVKTGAKAIVATSVPDYAHNIAIETGWQRIGSTDLYVYFLKK